MDVFPIIVVIAFFQLAIIQKPFPQLGQTLFGIVLVVIGLFTFILGLESALFPIGEKMANEFASLGVRVNAVAPGEIETEMVGPEYEMLIPRIPLNRMGTPGDVAGTVFYLCSEDAGYVTGTEIWVTGGQHLF